MAREAHRNDSERELRSIALVMMIPVRPITACDTRKRGRSGNFPFLDRFPKFAVAILSIWVSLRIFLPCQNNDCLSFGRSAVFKPLRRIAELAARLKIFSPSNFGRKVFTRSFKPLCFNPWKLAMFTRPRDRAPFARGSVPVLFRFVSMELG
jgi:hypothetical protein